MEARTPHWCKYTNIILLVTNHQQAFVSVVIVTVCCLPDFFCSVYIWSMEHLRVAWCGKTPSSSSSTSATWGRELKIFLLFFWCSCCGWCCSWSSLIWGFPLDYNLEPMMVMVTSVVFMFNTNRVFCSQLFLVEILDYSTTQWTAKSPTSPASAAAATPQLATCLQGATIATTATNKEFCERCVYI